VVKSGHMRGVLSPRRATAYKFCRQTPVQVAVAREIRAIKLRTLGGYLKGLGFFPALL
jgi:hypothetical protein